MFAFLLAISLLFTGNIAELAENRSIECHDCPGSNPNCDDICDGLYCYKAEFIANGQTTVKRGCLNGTDDGFRVGFCDDIPSNLPGSDVVAVERMCVCTTDKCNLTSAHSAAIAVIIVIMSFIFFGH